MSSNSFYSAGIIRVAYKASALGISFPGYIWRPTEIGDYQNSIYHTPLGAALMDNIEDPGIRYVFRLVHSIHTLPDWYSIEYSDVCELERYNDIECAHDKLFATRHIHELVERQGVRLREDICVDGSIRFFDDATLIVTLSPMLFSTADDLLVHKAKTILKKITSIHCETCLASMFSPLLAGHSVYAGCIEQHIEQREYSIHATLGNLVTSMRRAMEHLKVSISRGHAQELLAAFFNFPSWNHLRAIEHTCNGISINPAVVVDNRHDKPVIRYFQDDSHALAYTSTILPKGQAFSVKTSSTYGTLCVRQPPRGEHAFDSWPRTDNEDKAIVMYTLMQVDRYELDPQIPLNQPDIIHLPDLLK